MRRTRSTPLAARRKSTPELPAGTYHASGHEEQRVTVVPAREAVIVRLGLTRGRDVWDHGQFVIDVLAALPE